MNDSIIIVYAGGCFSLSKYSSGVFQSVCRPCQLQGRQVVVRRLMLSSPLHPSPQFPLPTFRCMVGMPGYVNMLLIWTCYTNPDSPVESWWSHLVKKMCDLLPMSFCGSNPNSDTSTSRTHSRLQDLTILLVDRRNGKSWGVLLSYKSFFRAAVWQNLIIRTLVQIHECPD